MSFLKVYVYKKENLKKQLHNTHFFLFYLKNSYKKRISRKAFTFS